MSRTDFYDGMKFKIFGVWGTIRYDAKYEEIVITDRNKVTHTSCIIEDDDQQGFSAYINICGAMQMVLIKFTACEETN